MLIVKIDAIDLQPAQTFFACFLHVIRFAIDADELLLHRIAQDSELRRDDDFLAMALEHAADQFLVGVRSVDIGRIEESNAQFERAIQCRDRFGFVAVAIEIGHAHAAEANRRYDWSSST